MKPVNTKISGKVNPLSYRHGQRPEQTASSKILTRVCQSCPAYQSPSHESRCSVHRLPEICASHIFKYIIKFDTLPRIQQTSTKMAKLIVTVALLLCVLALAQARASLDRSCPSSSILPISFSDQHGASPVFFSGLVSS